MKRIFALLLLAALVCGCSSNDVYRVNSVPEGATLIIPGAGNMEYTTPCDIPDRTPLGEELLIKKEGWLPRTFRLQDLPLIGENTFLIRLRR